MAYIYLLNLYDEIEKRIDHLSEQKADNSRTGTVQFEQGQKDLLIEFKQYLADNMNNKLPKRIRKRMSGQG